MRTLLIIAGAGLVVGLAAPALGPSSAWAGQEKAEKEYKAELKACKKIADPGQKDDCVRNARSTYEKRKQGVSNSSFGTEQSKDGAGKKAAPDDKIGLEVRRKKAASKDKGAATGAEELRKKAGEAK